MDMDMRVYSTRSGTKSRDKENTGILQWVVGTVDSEER